MQVTAVESLRECIIRPLEEEGVVVDVFAAVGEPGCGLYKEYLFPVLEIGKEAGHRGAVLSAGTRFARAAGPKKYARCLKRRGINRGEGDEARRGLNKSPLRDAFYFESSSQSDSVRGALGSFLKFFDNSTERIEEKYDFVLMTRVDVVWKEPFLEWPARFGVDLERFSFASRCERRVFFPELTMTRLIYFHTTSILPVLVPM